MKKLFLLLIIVFVFPIKSHAIDGRGELQMSEQAVGSFIRYIRGETSNTGKKNAFHKPSVFWITNDGQYGYWWYCAHSSCGADSAMEKKACENGTGMECARFARKRYVRWDNGINPKGNKAKFSSKMSDSEIRAKLTKLGFYNNSSKVETQSKEVDLQSNSETKTLIDQLKELTDLYQDGLITEEEFTKAKQRLLN